MSKNVILCLSLILNFLLGLMLFSQPSLTTEGLHEILEAEDNLNAPHQAHQVFLDHMEASNEVTCEIVFEKPLQSRALINAPNHPIFPSAEELEMIGQVEEEADKKLPINLPTDPGCPGEDEDEEHVEEPEAAPLAHTSPEPMAAQVHTAIKGPRP